MREIEASLIIDIIRDLCVKSNLILPSSIKNCIKAARHDETHNIAMVILEQMEDNISAAKKMKIPICQDTGMAVVFADIGQDIHIRGNFNDAVNEGVRRGYREGLLRCSVVADPLRRKNTEDNTPCILHTRVVDGDKIKLTVAPKGFGSENMSRIKMFNPSATREDVISFVVECVKEAGANPCPPVVVGIGIGSDFEGCALLSKRALCRENTINKDVFYAEMESEILDSVNALGIGPQGFGGRTTALCVNIEAYPTHIAGLPVAVNIGCHVTRHITKII